MWRRRTRPLLTLGLVVGGAVLAAAPARAADLFVEVDPSTVQAGSLVDIRASCQDNTLPATVESDAFGTVTVQPQGGALSGAAMVPEDTEPDNYRVVLNCPDGKTASTRLSVVAATRPSRGPATGFGGGVGDDPGALLLTGGLATVVAGVVLGLYARHQRLSPAAARRRVGADRGR